MSTKSLFVKPIDKSIVEKISRRRRQILVHSYIYYELDDNIISDTKWSEFALELELLQQKYPEESKLACYYQEFIGFDRSTAANLREVFTRPEIVKTAERLMRNKP